MMGRKFSQFSSVQLLSRVQLFVTPWTTACQASLSITNSRSLLRLMSIELVMPSNHLILCCPLLLWTSIFPSIRVFSNESSLCIRWPKNWSLSFSLSPSNEHSGLISFRMGWLDLLAVQGTRKSLLQHHSSNASILRFLYSPNLTFIHSVVWTQAKSTQRSKSSCRLQDPAGCSQKRWTRCSPSCSFSFKPNSVKQTNSHAKLQIQWGRSFSEFKLLLFSRYLNEQWKRTSQAWSGSST